MTFRDLQPPFTSLKVNWILGMTFGAMCYGALFILSVICIGHLRHSVGKAHPAKTFRNQHRVLQGHVALVLVLNTVMQVKDIQQFIDAIFYTDSGQLTTFFLNWVNIFWLMIALVTDGLLVSTSRYVSFRKSYP